MYFCCWIILHYMDLPYIFFAHSLIDGFRVDSSFKLWIQVSVLTYIFITSGYIPHSGITGSYDICIFNFKINFQNVFQTDCTILHVCMYVCIYIYWCCLISLTRASISMLNRSGNDIYVAFSQSLNESIWPFLFKYKFFKEVIYQAEKASFYY